MMPMIEFSSFCWASAEMDVRLAASMLPVTAPTFWPPSRSK
jgi:hypothetical protein